jgi:hypothetical protein
MSMIGGNNQRKNNKLFGWIRRKYAEETSKRQQGRIVSDEQKKKISDSLKGRPALHQTGDNNVSKRPEVAKKISEANKGKKRSPRSEETKQKISSANKGHTGLFGDSNPSRWRICCFVCKKETSLPSLGRNHKNCFNLVDI